MTSTGLSSLQLSHIQSNDHEEVQPDWDDKETQAEIAAQVQAEMADEMDNDNPYGMLNFEDQVDIELDTEDEEEVRKALGKGRKGWFEGVVDVFLRLEEEYPDQDLERGSETGHEDEEKEHMPSPKELRKRLLEEKLRDEEVVEPPDQSGVWEDVKWFGRVLARTVRS